MIPSWLVALSALILLILILRNGVDVDIRVFSLVCGLQLAEYTVFHFIEMPIETMQFIARLVVMTANIVLSIVIWGKRGK